MIGIEFSHIDCSDDEAVKKRAARKQMRALLSRLKAAPKYHTLTNKDRALLIKEGYARDLVDNLIFITTRLQEPPKTYDKQVVQSGSEDCIELGFNYAAFDPALYATSAIASHLKQLSNGCCALCESPLAATQSGVIGHFRPVALLDNAAIDMQSIHTTCSPYYDLAYDQENLLYVCKSCHALHKVGLFPVAGTRYPTVSIDQEQSLLVNPYQDDPRDYIRFNPLTGQAYAYDKVVAFLMASRNLSISEAERLIWSQPALIPAQAYSTRDCDEHSINEFATWFATCEHKTQIQLSRGELSIEIYGLNRPELVQARMHYIAQLHVLYSKAHTDTSANKQQKCADESPVSKHCDKAVVATDSKAPVFTLNNTPNFAYRSLAIDAFNTWQQGVVATQGQQPIGVPSSATVNDTEASISALRSFPVWFRSCIKYCVGESQLRETTKRQLVMLSGQDAFYGQKPMEKSVFLSINWLVDQHNVIKVKSHRNIWETSFAELANSRPQELSHLFSHNEVWVEGPFAALSAS